jgi:MFS family permease
MRAELSHRFACFYTASLVSGAFGGLLAGGLIEGMEGLGGIRGWKWLFMIEGAATVLIAIGAYFVLPSESFLIYLDQNDSDPLRLPNYNQVAERGGEVVGCCSTSDGRGRD